jgi:hypothetical protein
MPERQAKMRRSDQVRGSICTPGEGKHAVEPKPETPKSRGKALFQGQLSPKKLKKIKTLEQWVEITVEDGKTVTRLYPSNEQLIKDGQKMWPPPDLIYRRLNFVNGIPEEYRWTVRAGDEARMQRGGCGIQRMEVDT